MTFDFTKVQEIFAGDHSEYLSFLRIIKEDVAEAKQILSACTTSFSQKEYADLKHNLISTLRVFLLGDFAAAFEKGKVALDQNDRSGFLAAVDWLLTGFDAFEVELDKVLNAG